MVGNIMPDWRGIGNTIIETPIPIIPKEDGRKQPASYPQGTEGRDLATGCKHCGKWEQCTFGVKSPHGNDCAYWRFGIMCDKIVSSDGKEYN
jgi:hypothetical protein